MNLIRMTLHFVTIGKNTKLYIPPRFLKNPNHTKNYKTIVLIYRNLCEFYYSILSSLENMKKLQKELTETQECFKTKLEVFKQSVDSCRKKYVYAIWRPEDSDRLHNEMSVDVSTLLKESDEIGTLWRQIKASC
jgi:hypothetical protein